MNPETHLVDADQETSNYDSTQPCSSCITCPICLDDFTDHVMCGDNEDDINTNPRKRQKSTSSSYLFKQHSIYRSEELSCEKQLFWNVSKSCNHKVCDDCLVEYCVYTVSDSQLTPIPCPLHERYAQNKTRPTSSDGSMSSCTATISTQLVRRILRQTETDNEKNSLKKSVQEYFIRNEFPDILQNDTMSMSSSEMDEFDGSTHDVVQSDSHIVKEDAKTVEEARLRQCWKKYESLCKRQQLSNTLSNDNNTRTTMIITCPKCDEDMTWNNPSNHRLDIKESYQQCNAISFVECNQCHNRFCPLHGNAHSEDVSCMEYVSKPEYRSSIELIESTAKLCSHCNVPIQLVSGTCNHVVCSTCHNDMCYKCGTHIHLVGKGLRTCTNCSVTYRDHRYDRTRRVHIFVSLPCIIIVFFLWAISSILLALLSCCYCSLCKKQDTWIDNVIYNTNENNIDEADMVVTTNLNNEIPPAVVDLEQGVASDTKAKNINREKAGFNSRLQKFMRTIRAVTICTMLPLADAFTAFGIHPFWTGRQ